MNSKKTSVTSICVYIFLFVLIRSLFMIDGDAPETTLNLILPFLVASFFLFPVLICSFFIQLYKNIKNKNKDADSCSLKSVFFSWKVFWIVFFVFLFLGVGFESIFFWYAIPIVLAIYKLSWMLLLKEDKYNKPTKAKRLYTSEDILKGRHLKL